MFKREKKKTGIQTPEFRKPTPPPPPVPQPGVMNDGEWTTHKGRVYKLRDGDIFWANDEYSRLRFNVSLEDLTVGEEVLPGIICIEKVKRRHWWQFWKPKYRGARFMYVEKENNKCKD
jgi:hypothetical protein